MKRVDVYVLTWVLTLDLVKSAGHAGKLAHLYTQVTGHMLSLSPPYNYQTSSLQQCNAMLMLTVCGIIQLVVGIRETIQC